MLGYAQFPGGNANTDGVVVTYDAFGRIGNLRSDRKKGRTATHEVGHWLNLRHIWGDAFCGDDFVSDTPTQQAEKYDCPTHPQSSCGSNDMFMNYMDYTNDACKNLFTNGQRDRMRALFFSGGFRSGFMSVKIQQTANIVCGTPFTFSVPGQAGVNFNWTVTGAFQLTSGQGTNQITVSRSFVGPATISVRANGYCETKNVWAGTPAAGSMRLVNANTGSPFYQLCIGQSNYIRVQHPSADITQWQWSYPSGWSGYTYGNGATLTPPNDASAPEIRVRAYNACGWSNWASFYFPYSSYCGAYFAVYPNPTDGVLNIEKMGEEGTQTSLGLSNQTVFTATDTKPKNEKYDVSLYNHQGELILHQEAKLKKLSLDVAAYKPGIYVLHILYQDKIQETQVVIE
ncbi:MAG: T9SS type A sorting domain-containing protein [Bacteroidia bacterium]|nr:T9SS type A sorting domain-containing protein [Bacteroidia bacterium]